MVTENSAIRKAEEWVQSLIAHHDGSHDWWHIHRVRNTALRLAKEEGVQVPEALQVVEMAALLHDACDHKYCEQPQANWAALCCFLEGLPALSQQQRQAVLYIVRNVGFSEELAQLQQAAAAPASNCGGATQHTPAGPGPARAPGGEQAHQQQLPRLPLLLAAVQDADRLDAIGAIGIARCFTFGGKFGRVLHHPALPPRQGLTKETYQDKAQAQQATTLNHFHEKLLHLKGMMKTAAGRQLAEGRHEFMLQFLEQFHREWEAAA